MTETLALVPSGKNFGLVEFLPGLNMSSEDECRALVKAAETLGIDLIKEPFPGEPEGLCPAVRQDIWRMLLSSNLRDSLILRSRDMRERNFILSIAVFIGSAALLVCAEDILVTFFGLNERIFLPPIMILNALPAAACMAIVDYLTRKSLIRLNALLDDNSYTWPHRMVSCLRYARDKKASLSLELHALLEFIDEVDLESNWGVISLEDQIAMSKLSFSLESHKDRFSKGFILGLSGENSELVSRACSAVKPGRLEALMDRIERPETQYL